MFVSLLIAGALLTKAVTASPPSGTVTAAKPAQTTMTYAPAKTSDQKDNQLVCKSEPVLGSRLPVRRCRTVGDIKDRMLQDQQAIDRAQANIHIKSD